MESNAKVDVNKKKYRAIMLVDDNDLDNLINRKTIENHSLCDHFYVHTGAKSAIEFLRNIEQLETAQDIIPNLIILDVDMPFMDGFQFLEEFSRLSKLVRDTCRVVILTSSKNMKDLEQSRQYEAVDFFVRKPLSEKDIEEFSI